MAVEDTPTEDSTRDVEAADSPTDEDAAPKKPVLAKKPPFLSRKFIIGPVDTTHADLALLAHSVASGMIDAAAFSNWKVFVAMQTGNTVLLGLSTATIPSNPHAWTTTLVSITSYLVGAFCTFRAAEHIVPKGACSSRLFLMFLFLLQALLILVTAILVTVNLIPHNVAEVATLGTHTDIVDNVLIVAALPPLAFQAGLQIATSRLLGFNEIPVNVLTSTYCDIMGDAHMLAAHNVKRNRRVASVFLLFAGAISGAWLQRSKGGLPSVLFVACGIKFSVGLAVFLFMPPRLESDEGDHVGPMATAPINHG